MISSILALALIQSPNAKAVTLARVFSAGEKYNYQIKSHITLENRALDLETFLPFEYDLNYAFTAEVKQMKADGIAQLQYARPTMTEIQASSDTTRPEVKTENVGYDFLLTVSPINEIIDKVDLRKPKPAKKGALSISKSAWRQQGKSEVQQFVSELYRLALFNGPVETALDFSPKFPFWDVVPGDTWKRTVGYQPQALNGKTGKAAVQRLDYTYTYRGTAASNGKTVQRVTADLNLDTDLAPWARQYLTPSREDPQITKMPMTLKATIEFDLDPKTFDTLAARAYSQGGFKVFLSDQPSQIYFESKLKGTTTLSLRSLTR